MDAGELVASLEALSLIGTPEDISAATRTRPELGKAIQKVVGVAGGD